MALGYLDDSKLTAIADSIRSKTGKSATMTVDEMPDEIESISGGGGGGNGSMADPIRFFDYDGTVVASFKSVPDSLPDNPRHDGLIAQGWNHTIEEIAERFDSIGLCDVGQMYMTESGATEIDVMMPYAMSPRLSIAVSGTVEIDWGDGTAPVEVSGTSTTTRLNPYHNYSAGEYTIKVRIKSGDASFYCNATYTLLHYGNSTANRNRAYSNCVQAVRVGEGIYLGSMAFAYCRSLKYVTIPSRVKDTGGSLFQYCNSLEFVAMPDGLTNIQSQMFSYCRALKAVSLSPRASSCGISIFDNCESLASASIPGKITSTNNSMYANCVGLVEFTVPSGVTYIANGLFSGCQCLRNVRFKRSVPPTLANTNVFSNTYCDILVPRDSVDAYKAATNWSTYASRIMADPES